MAGDHSSEGPVPRDAVASPRRIEVSVLVIPGLPKALK